VRCIVRDLEDALADAVKIRNIVEGKEWLKKK